MHECTNCRKEWPSRFAAELCCDPDPDDDRWIDRGRE